MEDELIRWWNVGTGVWEAKSANGTRGEVRRLGEGWYEWKIENEVEKAEGTAHTFDSASITAERFMRGKTWKS